MSPRLGGEVSEFFFTAETQRSQSSEYVFTRNIFSPRPPRLGGKISEFFFTAETQSLLRSFQIMNHSFDALLEHRHIEVDQQSDGPSAQFQIGQQLSLVNRLQTLHCF